MIGLTITVAGLDRLQHAYRVAPDLIKKRMGPALHRAGLRVEREAKLHLRRAGITTQGKLAQSIATTMDLNALAVRVGPRLQIAPYAHLIELGRAPAGELPGGKGPPVKIGGSLNLPFARWAKKKAGVANATNKKGARDLFALARAIRAHGWKPKPYMEPAGKAAAPGVVKDLEQAVDKALEDFARG